MDQPATYNKNSLQLFKKSANLKFPDSPDLAHCNLEDID